MMQKHLGSATTIALGYSSSMAACGRRVFCGFVYIYIDQKRTGGPRKIFSRGSDDANVRNLGGV
jgi:hypothetical protein